jgi:hypothetical protein
MTKTSSKPALTLAVAGSSGRIAPPRPLGKHGRNLWNAVTSEYRVDDAGGRELLALAAASLDRAEALGAAIKRDGVVIAGEKGVRSHPGIKDEIACRALCARLIERMGLSIEAVKPPGRPVTPRGWPPP